LRDICLNEYFRNLQDFELNANMTFQWYVYTLNSGLVCTRKLLPPNFPSILLIFDYDTFETEVHPECPGERSWHGKIHRDFDIPSEAISALPDMNKKTHSVAAHMIGQQHTPKPLVSHCL